jgi:hypothetical protein
MTNRVIVPARQDGNRLLGSLKCLQIRALVGPYDNSIPTRFLAHIDSLKVPAQIKIKKYEYVCALIVCSNFC